MEVWRTGTWSGGSLPLSRKTGVAPRGATREGRTDAPKQKSTTLDLTGGTFSWKSRGGPNGGLLLRRFVVAPPSPPPRECTPIPPPASRFFRPAASALLAPVREGLPNRASLLSGAPDEVVAPGAELGWAEPGQTPDFEEFTVVLRGSLRVEHTEGAIEVAAGQAVITHRREWVRYSSPGSEGAEYIAVCAPAFSPDLVRRDAD